MNKLLALTAAIATVLVSGCSAIQQGDSYSSATLPTAQSLALAGGEQRFNDTLFVATDFNADGSARGFSQYNFAAESAPCTVMGDTYSGASIDKPSAFYAVNRDGQKFLFNCRSVERGTTTPAMRLFLIGSSADCAQRSTGVNGQMSTFAKELELKCNGYRISRGQPTKTDLAYTQS